MELSGVLLTQVGRRQVCAAAKPGLPLHLHQNAVEGLNRQLVDGRLKGYPWATMKMSRGGMGMKVVQDQ